MPRPTLRTASDVRKHISGLIFRYEKAEIAGETLSRVCQGLRIILESIKIEAQVEQIEAFERRLEHLENLLEDRSR